ncbi:peroxide stress protein YaaA [Faecalispora anaeroviscerum]|uniref:peroxide stress protein YaaA n=1 Tax=Faecalispora anaeroviscerum TaxID=2991836 RepID=UPI0024BAA715|nr:peroxide stress protein YaaA [Faecalispora anaeroviscerum]
MRIIISPAKKMNTDTDSLPCESMPQFFGQTETLLCCLRNMDYAGLKALWRCNDSIADLNYRRVQTMDLRHALTPAILSYEGIQYQYMAPGVFEREQLRYISEHLRILSGFYGLLRPFDGVTPYRLEMQARLSVGGEKDLYAFWGNRLAHRLCSETGLILNLASKEYSKAVLPYLPGSVRFLTCTFGERKDGKVIEKGTLCKMARGEMVRWLAEQQLTDPADIRGFDRMGYTYRKELSNQDHYVFVKESGKKQNANTRLDDC